MESPKPRPANSTWLNFYSDGLPRPLVHQLTAGFVKMFFDEAKLINDLTLEAFDPFSKQPDYKKCAVRIRKA